MPRINEHGEPIIRHIETEKDLVAELGDLKYRMKASVGKRKPMIQAFDDVLNMFLNIFNLDQDQHVFAAVPEEGIPEKEVVFVPLRRPIFDLVRQFSCILDDTPERVFESLAKAGIIKMTENAVYQVAAEGKDTSEVEEILLRMKQYDTLDKIGEVRERGSAND